MDAWSQWIFKNRFGGEKQAYNQMMAILNPIRDKMIEIAEIENGDRVLDVGCGDGFMGLGVLEKYPDCQIVFLDVSHSVIDTVREIAQKNGISGQCRFHVDKVENMKNIASTSIDVAIGRSVLIYVPDKLSAFQELARVLKPEKGRFSLFEPVNNYFEDEPNTLWGYDVSALDKNIVEKVKNAFSQFKANSEEDPMLNFTERDLFHFAENAGFSDLKFNLEAQKATKKTEMNWSSFINTAPNPKIPSIAKILDDNLSENQKRIFSDFMSKKFDNGLMASKEAFLYLYGGAITN